MRTQQGVRRIGSAWARGLMVGALGLFGAGACGPVQDEAPSQVHPEDAQESPEVSSSLSLGGDSMNAMSVGFVATLQNASRNGTQECLIMGGNGQDTHPIRYLWGGGANGFCGLSSNAELLANKQAVWKFTSLGNDQYILTNASRNGTEECLIMGGNGQDAHPIRYLWGGGANGFCGLSSVAELLANKQAVWTLKPLGNGKYTLTNASRTGTEECLIMGGNGQDTSPVRYLWGGGANGSCGLPNNADLLANQQAVWTVALISDAAQATLAARFAPRLRFDGSGHGYPMSAQTFYDLVIRGGSTARVENTTPSTLGSGQIPTYYQVIECGAQVRIKYWWFYGYQSACDAFGNGTHNGDWENVVVTLSEDQSTLAAVTFNMHGHTYTRLAARGGFSVEESTHPVVYVGKSSHAAHYEQGGSSDTCLPWEEFRNNSSGLHLDSWSNLVNLDRDTGPLDWIVADRQGGFVWGPDGISNHPTQNGPSCFMNAADWTWDVPTWWHSQCKIGDRDDGTSCHTQCRPGYTDMGLTCTNWSIFSLDTYSQHIYGYDYTLPSSDVGLLANDYN